MLFANVSRPVRNPNFKNGFCEIYRDSRLMHCGLLLWLIRADRDDSRTVSHQEEAISSLHGGIGVRCQLRRGRDADHSTPPAQIRTCALTHTAPNLHYERR